MTSWTRRFKEVIVTRFRRVARWAHGGVGHVFSFAQARLRPLVLLVLIAAVAVGVWGMISFWEWLRDGPDGLESGSTTVRNLGFVIAGVVALPLAIWRSLVAQRQADTAQQNLLNERYQQGAEMLGSDVLAVRLGGIYALERLAAEHPEQYHVQIMQLFCAFVRFPTGRNKREDGQDVAEDVQIALRVIGTRSKTGIDLEGKCDFSLDLYRANLSRASLIDADLSRAILIGANLSGASLARAKLFQVRLNTANLSGVHFYDVAGLMGIDAKESAAKGLTQQQLNSARADPNNPPDLDGHVLDAETGKQLVWRGKPLDTT